MPRALLSVTDKSGLAEFARGLAELGWDLISTGGTARAIREAGLPVSDVAEATGFPEMLDGRVKTLHPAIHGGLLAVRDNPAHLEAAKRAGIEPIDLLCVNLYAFEATVTADHRWEDAIESIDIGGPAMVRSAAKNHRDVLPVVDPADYAPVLAALRTGVGPKLRLRLAAKAFRHTAYYDSIIARYLTAAAGEEAWPETWTIGMRWDGAPLRYGENPHQSGARYLDPMQPAGWRVEAGAGKEISYNNWLDAEAAWELVCDLPAGACAIIKHGNPCGAAVGGDLGESYRIAKSSDPVSAYGGIVAFHGPLDRSAIEAMVEKGNFLEVVLATGWTEPGLREEFLAGPAWTANVRFLIGPAATRAAWRDVRSLRGAYLLQDRDEDSGPGTWEVVTKRAPTEVERRALEFAWTVVPHVRSNAIVVAAEDRMLGAGAGQMNRVQSVRLALEQAGEAARGAALASDAFFPFPDSVDSAAAAGIAAIIQPGGSKKDSEVVASADRHGISMILTGTRHFRH